MKKLLVLLLVLGLVSTASATPKELRVAMGITPGVAPDQSAYYDPDPIFLIIPSDLLWIGIYNTTQGGPGDLGQQSMFLGITANGGGEWTMNWKIYYGEVEPNPPYGDPGYPDFYNEYIGVIPPYGDLWILNMLSDPWTGYVGVGVVDAKEFHCLNSAYAVTVTLYDVEANPVDSFVINVPEPTTVSLLGLGVLGIVGRRKRR